MRIDREDLLRIAVVGGVLFGLIDVIACIRKKKFLPLFTKQNGALLLFCWYSAVLLHLTGLLDLILLRYPEGIVLRDLLKDFRWDLFRGHVFRPVLQNFLLFLPLGFLAPPAIPRVRWNLLWVLLLGFGVSCSIELLQGLIGRVQELDDIIMNTSGTLAGFLTWSALFGKRWKPWQRIALILLTVGLSYAGLYEIRQLCLNATGG